MGFRVFGRNRRFGILLGLMSSGLAIPALTSPANAAVLTDTTPELTWNVLAGAATYRIQIADNAAFTSPTVDDDTLITNGYTLGSALDVTKIWYWRVAMISPSAVQGAWSSTYLFGYTITLQLAAMGAAAAIWPLNEAAGATIVLDASGNARNGVYENANMAGETAWPLGGTVAHLDGTEGINVFSTSLRDAMNWEEYSVILFAKVPLSLLAEGAQHDFIFLASTGSTQRIELRSTATPYTLSFVLDTGAASKTISATSIVNTDWMMFAATNSKAADAMKGFLNGVQIGATTTGLGTADGSVMVAAVIGAVSAAGVVGLIGDEGYVAFYPGVILTPTAIATLYNNFLTLNGSSGTWVIGTGDSTWTGESLMTNKLVTGLGSSYHFVYELAVTGLTAATWKAGTTGWLGIDAELAKLTWTKAPGVVVLGLGKNEMTTMPTEANFKADVGYGLDAMNVKWPNMRVLIEIPWRSGKDTEANTIKTWYTDIMATRSWASIGTDETGYFRTAELATPSSYSSDGVHIDTAAGTTARAAEIQAAIEAL